jgi:hypothetical protein
MGSVPRVPKAPSAAPGQDRAQRAEIVANLEFRGAGCRSPARPDLGEARAGNFSGLPNPKFIASACRNCGFLDRPVDINYSYIVIVIYWSGFFLSSRSN